ncbi:MAG: alcohol dehydrogenase catalytic domain-containing protein [Pseudomonadota bacterium]
MKKKIVSFSRLGGPEVLKLELQEELEPKANEVRISVKAIGLNRAETLFRAGTYLERPDLPSRIGYEASGIVDAVGAGVSHLAVGDKVSVVPAFQMNDYGVHGETAIVPARAVVKHPDVLSFEEAAGFWMQYLTAAGALFDVGKANATARCCNNHRLCSLKLADIEKGSSGS